MKEVKILLLSAPGKNGVFSGQLVFFRKFARQLRSGLGITTIDIEVDFKDLPAVAAACARHAEAVSVFVLHPNWNHEVEGLRRLLVDLRARHPRHRIVFIDPWDQCTGGFLGLLPHVDKFVKYMTYRDRSQYLKPMLGGELISDYMAREQGFDLKGANYGSTADPNALGRLCTGAYFSINRGLLAKLLVPRIPPFYPIRRDVDVVCHISFGTRNDDTVYLRHRQQAHAAVEALRGRFTVASSGEYIGERTVSSKQYKADMKRSKIALSPFGYGEVSSRAFEAIAFGNLLMAPQLDHVELAPDIFVAGETYVALKWDCSDLAEKVSYYLAHWDESKRMIEKSRRALLNYYRRREYLCWISEAVLGQTAPGIKQPLRAASAERA